MLRFLSPFRQSLRQRSYCKYLFPTRCQDIRQELAEISQRSISQIEQIPDIIKYQRFFGQISMDVNIVQRDRAYLTHFLNSNASNIFSEEMEEFYPILYDIILDRIRNKPRSISFDNYLKAQKHIEEWARQNNFIIGS